MIRPPFIREGARIALCAPSYRMDDGALDAAVAALRAMGFDAVEAPHARSRHAALYAGTPKERAADLVWAFESPDIDAVMATRGGYGTIQLLDLLPRDLFARHPKWLVGYSDISSLHCACTSQGVMSLHGIMGSSLAHEVPDAESLALTRELLLGHLPAYEWHWPAYGATDPLPEDPASPCLRAEASSSQNAPATRTGSAEGVLLGGNMATFVPLVGTAYDCFARHDNIILFVEEVEETAHNIDRMFNILRLHGVMDKVRGVVLGAFTGCPDEFRYGGIERMLLESVLPKGLPVACAFPAGHSGQNHPLIEGAPVRLEVSPGCARLTFRLP